MNINLAARLVALGIGATLILNAASRSSATLARRWADVDGAVVAVTFVPVLVALILARLIFVYARNIRFEDVEPSGLGVLAAGVKLLGIYLIVTGIPALLGAVSLFYGLLDGQGDAAAFLRNALTMLIYIGTGIVFAFRTEWIVAMISRDA